MAASVLAGAGGILVAPVTGLDPVTTTLLVVPALAAALVGRLVSFGATVAAALGLGMAQSLLLLAPGQLSWFPRSGVREALPLVVIVVALALGAGGPAWPGRTTHPAGGCPGPAARGGSAVGAAGTVAGGRRVRARRPGPHGPGDQPDRRAGVPVDRGPHRLVGPDLPRPDGLRRRGRLLPQPAGRRRRRPVPHRPAARRRTGRSRRPARGPSRAAGPRREPGRRHPGRGGGGRGGGVQEPDADRRLRRDPRAGASLSAGARPVAARPSPCSCWPCSWPRPSAWPGCAPAGAGRRLLAVRANERAAAAVGVDVTATRLRAFALSAFLAGVAGALLGYQQGQLSFGSFGVFVSLAYLAVAYLGGVAGIGGALVGGLLVPNGLAFTLLDLGRYQLLASGLGLMAVTVLAPGGLTGWRGDDA